MYLLKNYCDYCDTYCSREDEDKGKLPLLYTPQIPFMKEVVCENCMKKIKDGMGKIFESFTVLPTEQK